jgi:hypothetical protein
MRTFGLGLCLFFCSLASCSPPADTGGAQSRLVGQGFLHTEQLGNLFRTSFGLKYLSKTQVVSSQSYCEGAAGSVIPPMAVKECVESGISAFFRPLDELQLLGSGASYPENHIYLSGIERFWVPQSKSNDCWAAALETARRYLNLRYVSQDELIESTQRLCPRLADQAAGADTYQITFAIAAILSRYDIGLANPHFCDNGECIVASLSRNRPVIMLRSGHAVLVVGADFLVGTHPYYLVVIKNLKILDPAGSGEIEDRSAFNLCSADAFIAY